MTVIGIAALALLFAWLFGSVLLRAGGAAVALAGLTVLALSGDANGILVFALGALLWLGGQWQWALRHHAFKSPLARYVFLRWAPAWLDPTRGWALAVAPERADRKSRGRGRAS